MERSTAQNLRAVAPQILSGKITKETPFAPEVVKRAIDILSILRDGKWHTAADIGEQLSLNKRYIQQIFQVCGEAWALDRQGRKGVRSTLNFCPCCQSVYHPDDEGDHTYHECDRCGWHWIDAPIPPHTQGDEASR